MKSSFIIISAVVVLVLSLSFGVLWPVASLLYLPYLVFLIMISGNSDPELLKICGVACVMDIFLSSQFGLVFFGTILLVFIIRFVGRFLSINANRPFLFIVGGMIYVLLDVAFMTLTHSRQLEHVQWFFIAGSSIIALSILLGIVSKFKLHTRHAY